MVATLMSGAKWRINLNYITMDGFIFGVILGAVITACAMTKSVRDGFKDLFNGIFKKGGDK